ALLKERVAAGQHRNWLLFGERQQAHDFHYGGEIRAWLAQGQLERADFAWSRDQPERVYVQQRLREAAGELRRWVGEGAAIYVCGSLDGMAPAVDEALGEVLGAAQLEQWREQGRYRRDVY
ncbi:MAG: sulfite reductase flavoprotein subunit alpha, partial [Rhodanobacter sp.]